MFAKERDYNNDNIRTHMVDTMDDAMGPSKPWAHRFAQGNAGDAVCAERQKYATFLMQSLTIDPLVAAPGSTNLAFSTRSRCTVRQTCVMTFLLDMLELTGVSAILG